MKKSITICIVGLILIISSCSTTVNDRAPSAIENQTFTEVFSFVSTPNDSKTSYQEEAKNLINDYVSNAHEGRRVDIVQSKSLAKGVAFNVELIRDLKNGMMIFQINSAPNAFKDHVATTNMMNFVTRLLQGFELGSGHAAFEMYYNAKAGDPIALENFLKIREKDHSIQLNNQPNPDLNKEADDHKKYTKELRDILAGQIIDLKKKRATDELKRKAPLEALDKAPEGKQFRAMIARNDRIGAMAVLRKYLPWEDMAPFEKQFWENYISVNENPVPLDQRVIIYRGLNEDFINRGIVVGKELTEKEAILSGNAFIMSSGMVKNQGSWNRRLRSLEAMNQKYIATMNGSNEFSQSARITVMFDQHAREPKGSPFISFTPEFSTAHGFGDQRVSSYLIDPRLLNFNYASTFDNEYEFLLPLSTFPEDMIAIADNSIIEGDDKIIVKNPEAYLEDKLEKIVAKKFGEANKKKILIQIKKNTYDFFKLKFPHGKDVKAPDAPATNLKFYKGFLNKGDVNPTMKPNGELTCKDLIEFFWMIKK